MQLYKLPRQTHFYRGKVRDVYTIDDTWLVMIASDRISAFDVILPRPIPYKGQVLNQIAAHMLEATREVCPNWLLATPAPNVSIGKKYLPLRVEMVVRGNLTGHAWRTYASGKRKLCGVNLPEGMRENDFFPTPIITPSTKATEGHDEDISREEIIASGLVAESDYELMEDFSLRLFDRGRKMAAEKELILADTKYEFGKDGSNVCLMDEIHTPDSSRYFYADGFQERQARNERQIQLSKEFVREWLIENNFMGQKGQVLPEMTDKWIATISERYIQLYEKLIGNKFNPVSLTQEETEIKIKEALDFL